MSTETIAPARARAAMTGRMRACSSSGDTGVAPGRVLSPPMSRISAPSACIWRPVAMATPGSRRSPPSLKLSGVMLRMPMRAGWVKPAHGGTGLVRIAGAWRAGRTRLSMRINVNAAGPPARGRAKPDAMAASASWPWRRPIGSGQLDDRVSCTKHPLPTGEGFSSVSPAGVPGRDRRAWGWASRWSEPRRGGFRGRARRPPS